MLERQLPGSGEPRNTEWLGRAQSDRPFFCLWAPDPAQCVHTLLLNSRAARSALPAALTWRRLLPCPAAPIVRNAGRQGLILSGLRDRPHQKFASYRPCRPIAAADVHRLVPLAQRTKRHAHISLNAPRPGPGHHPPRATTTLYYTVKRTRVTSVCTLCLR